MNRDTRQNHTNKNNSKPQRILTMAVKTFLACRHVFFTHMIWEIHLHTLKVVQYLQMVTKIINMLYKSNFKERNIYSILIMILPY